MIIIEYDESLWVRRWCDHAARLGIDHEVVQTVSLESANSWLPRAHAYLARPLHYQIMRLEVHRYLQRRLVAEGRFVFPSGISFEDYDNKASQAWTLAAHEFPHPKTAWIISRREAIDFLRTSNYPIVAKLSSGAGSSNVRLLRNQAMAHRYLAAMFDRGVSPAGGLFSDFRTRVGSTATLGALAAKMRRLPRTIRELASYRRSAPKHQGYVLLQEFIPQADHDVRVTVVCDRVYVFVRRVRPGDFRASGSGRIHYPEPGAYPECARLGRSLADRLGAPTLAVDFVLGSRLEPYIVEYSYTFDLATVEACTWAYSASGEVIADGCGPAELLLEAVHARA